MDAKRRIIIPKEIVEHLGFRKGKRMYLRYANEEITLITNKEVIK